ncbi:hypothetical protein [Amycolatopsis rhizosphaerae]|nr:hypothetical protein [Amycolatopsis rhizosphaerae]
MDEDYLWHLQRWLGAEPSGAGELATGQETEPMVSWLPVPRAPLD